MACDVSPVAMFCPKQSKGLCNFIPKSVFSLNTLVEGGRPNADDCWRRGGGGLGNCWRLLTRGGGGVWKPLKLADIICGQPLTTSQHMKRKIKWDEIGFRISLGTKGTRRCNAKRIETRIEVLISMIWANGDQAVLSSHHWKNTGCSSQCRSSTCWVKPLSSSLV